MIDKTDLAQGLVAGWLINQVEDRGQVPQRIAVGVAVLGFIGLFVLSGWWRALIVVLLFVACFVAGFIFAARWLAKRFIYRFHDPTDPASTADEVQAALDRADLPTDPMGIVQFLYRLRKGVGTEVDRLTNVVTDLQTELDKPRA